LFIQRFNWVVAGDFIAWLCDLTFLCVDLEEKCRSLHTPSVRPFVRRLLCLTFLPCPLLVIIRTAHFEWHELSPSVRQNVAEPVPSHSLYLGSTVNHTTSLTARVAIHVPIENNRLASARRPTMRKHQ
jgi:hypothetical protein